MQLVSNPRATNTIRSTETRTTCWMEWLLERLYEGWGGKGYFITGTGLHTAFDHLIRGIPYEEAEGAMLDWIWGQIDAYETAGIELQWTKSRPHMQWEVDSKRMLRNWYDDVHPEGDMMMAEFMDIGWPPKSEVWLDVGATDFHLKTQADAIYDGRRIVDWKTGANKSADDRQLHVYWWAARQLGLVDDGLDFDAGFYFAQYREYVPASMEYPGDDYIYQYIAEAERRRTAGTYFYEPSWKCKFCAVSSVCPAWPDNDSLPWPTLMAQAEKLEFTEVNE